MIERAISLLSALIWCSTGCHAAPPLHQVSVDTSGAWALVNALSDPKLSKADALRVADLPPTMALIRKSQNFDAAATRERFADELIAAARKEPTDKSRFAFERVYTRREEIRSALKAIDSDKAGLAGWIADRVRQFSPPGPPLQLTGYIIAGGRSVGFALGGPEFYLNVAAFGNDVDGMKVVAAHELYHSVQRAAERMSDPTQEHGYSDERLASISNKEERNAYLVESFFENLKTEGVASVVGDPTLPLRSSTWLASERKQLQDRLNGGGRLTALLDLSLVSLTAGTPVSYRVAQSVGFNGDEPLYSLGYAMAKAIADKRGASAVGEASIHSGCSFVLEYLALAKNDRTLMQLGPSTILLASKYCATRGGGRR